MTEDEALKILEEAGRYPEDITIKIQNNDGMRVFAAAVELRNDYGYNLIIDEPYYDDPWV